MKAESPESPSSITSRLRLGLTLIIVLIVISSPIVMMVNPSLIAASFSKEGSSSSTDAAAPSTIGQEGDFAAQAPLQIPRTLQSTDLVNSLAIYEVTFITSTTGAIDKIRMDFPEGTNVAAAGVIERVGIGGGTLLKSGSSITYDVSAPVSIPAGTFIRLELFGIKNPTIPSTTSATSAIITTRDSGGNLIDGPSATNQYIIKQIGSNDVAESFMHRVTLIDGSIPEWDPDGVQVSFSIPDPFANGPVFDQTFITVAVTDLEGVNIVAFCDAAPGSFGTFIVRCESAPPNGSELHYVMTVLPEHV